MTNVEDGNQPDRYSKALEPEIVADQGEKAVLEVKNALRQFDEGMLLVDDAAAKRSFFLRPSTIVGLNRSALQGLSSYAGVFRPSDIEIVGSKHKPIAANLVPAEIERLCDYINDHWHSKSALHLAAYVLWRINWIHPFVDGNGRTARIVAYVVLCAKLGYRLPGALTIPEQIADNKQPYYKALEDADRIHEEGKIDVSTLENLLSEHLANQLLEVHQDANAQAGADTVAFKTRREAARPRSGLLGETITWVESHPVIVGAIVILIAAIITVAFQTG